MEEHMKRGSKESVEVKLKDGIYTELCFKPWFEND